MNSATISSSSTSSSDKIKFWRNFFLLIASVILTCIALSFADTKPYNPNDSNYILFSVADKQARAESIHVPKIILVGASNLLFGIDSKMMQDSLHMPVANMSLSGSLGLIFDLNQAADVARPGDVVLLSIEYELNLYSHPGYLNAVVTALGPKVHYTPFRDDYNLFLFNASPARMQKHVKHILGIKDIVDTLKPGIFTYKYSGIDSLGDEVNHCREKSGTTDLGDRYLVTFGDGSECRNSVNVMNDFCRKMQAKGVKVYFEYPPFAQREFERGKEAINQIAAYYSSNLLAEQISKPGDYIYPDSVFFDTVYHLNCDARALRTRRLIKELQSRLAGIAKSI